MKVIDDGDLRKYRTEIPNSIDDMGLSVYAYRLYGHYKRVAGTTGVCFQGTRLLAEHCKMSVGMVSKAKKELLDAGLIVIEERDRSMGESDVVRIVDIWADNFAKYAKAGGKEEPPVHHMNTPVHSVNSPVQDVNTPVHVVNERSNSFKKEPDKKEDAAAQQEKSLPPHQEMFGAICDALGWDPNTLSKRSKGQVGEAASALLKANYTVDDVRQFMTKIWFNDYRWKDKQSLPNLEQLRTEIGKLRSSVPEHTSQNSGSSRNNNLTMRNQLGGKNGNNASDNSLSPEEVARIRADRKARKAAAESPGVQM